MLNNTTVIHPVNSFVIGGMMARTHTLQWMKRKPLSDADKAAAVNLRRIWDAQKTKRGLTQDNAAEKLGFGTQGAVSHYLTGYTPLNTDAVLKFAALLGVAPTDIRPDLDKLLAVAAMPAADSDVVNEFAAVYAGSNKTWRTFLETSIHAARGAIKEADKLAQEDISKTA